MLADTPSPRGSDANFFLLQLWVHCPRASNGLLPRRSYLVGYAQWDARFDLFLLCQTIMSNSFTGRSMARISSEQSELVHFAGVRRFGETHPAPAGENTKRRQLEEFRKGRMCAGLHSGRCRGMPSAPLTVHPRKPREFPVRSVK